MDRCEPKMKNFNAFLEKTQDVSLEDKAKTKWAAG